LNIVINNCVRITGREATRNGKALLSLNEGEALLPEDLYRSLQFSYPKFFKMDMLCKWAWLGAECVLGSEGKFLYEGMDRNKVAVVIFTSSGCLEADRKYQQSIKTIPSPALFVYTLSNIMLGEICIRHGFKGEQLCMVSEAFDPAEMYFWVSDLLNNRGMDACLCGWVEAEGDRKDVCLFWVGKEESGTEGFSAAAMRQHYNS
jgi:hypothetical protein